MFNNFISNNLVFFNNVGKYIWAREATNDNAVRRMLFMCWIIKARNTHSE